MGHDIHTKFHKDWFRHLKVNRGGFTDIQSVWRLHKHTLGKYAKNVLCKDRILNRSKRHRLQKQKS
jgi:hypothetical protein